MTSPVRAPRSTPRSLPAAPNQRLRPDLRIVGAPGRRTRTGLVVSTATVVVFSALFAGAVAHSLLVGGQVHLDEVGVETRAQHEQLQLEQLRLADLQSPGRIAREASRLGMVPARQQNWVSPVAGAAPVVTGAAPQAAPQAAPLPPADADPGTGGEPMDADDRDAEPGGGHEVDGTDEVDDATVDAPVDRSPDPNGNGSELAAGTSAATTAEP